MGQVQRGSTANREPAKVDCRRLSTPEDVIALPKRWISVAGQNLVSATRTEKIYSSSSSPNAVKHVSP